jgi:hypothetical protein
MGDQTKDKVTVDSNSTYSSVAETVARTLAGGGIRTPYSPNQNKKSFLTEVILGYIDKPKTSKEVQDYFETKGYKRNIVRTILLRLYRQGKIVRSPFKTIQGYIYSLPEQKDKIVEKLKEIVPPYVWNAVNLIVSQRRMFTLNHLVEVTNGNYETLEYYLDNVFGKELNRVKHAYYKSFKVYWSSEFEMKDLKKDFLQELSEKHREIKVKSREFEKRVEELLDKYLFSMPFKVEKTSRGTPSGKFFDLSYVLYIFHQPVHLKVEVKSYIPNVYQVAMFYRKVREFKHGTVIPVIVAPAFPSIVYQTFGDIVYLLPFDKLEKIVEVVLSTKTTQ